MLESVVLVWNLQLVSAIVLIPVVSVVCIIPDVSVVSVISVVSVSILVCKYILNCFWVDFEVTVPWIAGIYRRIGVELG